MTKTTHIVCLSGGKDSTAMALRLKELYPSRKFVFMFTPTGDELPCMVEHLNIIEKKLGAPILRLSHPKYPTIYELIEHFQMLPNFRARWCTRILKIEVAQNFYQENQPAIIYVGLRADEPNRKGNKLYDENIIQNFPMKEWEWDIGDVLAYLDKKKIIVPQRTGCAMCFYQRIGEWWDLWKFHPGRFAKIEAIEKRLNHTLLSPGKFSNWPSPLKDLRKEFGRGRVPKGANNQIKLFNN